jgi:hypothetical protein
MVAMKAKAAERVVKQAEAGKLRNPAHADH